MYYLTSLIKNLIKKGKHNISLNILDKY